MLHRKIFKVVCMLMIMAMMLSGCGRRKTTNQPVTPKEESGEDFSDFVEETTEPEETEVLEETPEPDNRIIIDTQNAEIQGEYNGYYYQQLSISQKVVFAAILANISVIQE